MGSSHAEASTAGWLKSRQQRFNQPECDFEKNLNLNRSDCVRMREILHARDGRDLFIACSRDSQKNSGNMC